MSVLDMSPIIAPKSNQLTADDLLSGDRTITITSVELAPGAEQPCRINYEGDGGKPWYPCKSMGRVLVKAWGPDAKNYVGKSVQLLRDPEVLWAGMKVGGIRIKALSHIDAAFDMALTATRGKKAMSRFFPLKADVRPINNDPGTHADAAAEWAAKFIGAIGKATDLEKLDELASKHSARLEEMREKRPELFDKCGEAMEAKRDTFAPASDGLDDGDGLD